VLPLTYQIKQHLHQINDGSTVKDLCKSLDMDRGAVLAALMELQHEVIQGEDQLWYLDRCAKLEPPEPRAEETKPVEAVIPKKPAKPKKPVAPIPAAEPVAKPDHPAIMATQEPDHSPYISKQIIDFLAEEEKAGRGPYCYREIADRFKVGITTAQSTRTTIKKRHPELIPLLDRMIVQERVARNLASANKGMRVRLEKHGHYNWKGMLAFLKQEQAAGRGPYASQQITDYWDVAPANRTRTRRAIAAIREYGAPEDVKVVDQMICLARKDLPSFEEVQMNPQPKKPAAPMKKAVASASIEKFVLLDEINAVRAKLQQKPKKASRWAAICQGLHGLLGELDFSEDNSLRMELAEMSQYFLGDARD
jgi:hypothetical protein